MKPTEKYQTLIDACVAKMNEADQAVYRPIAEYAVELGYTPKAIKKANGNVDELVFSKSKVNRSLLRINPCNDKLYGQVREVGKALLRLVFFATPEYSEAFRLGVKNVIETFGENSSGCYGCGRCDGDLQGYTYVCADGRTVFRCGRELLLELPPLALEHVEEVKAMMKTQNDFWLRKAEAAK